MFTGIVQGTAKVVSIDDKPNFRTHVVELPRICWRGWKPALGSQQRLLPDGDDINGARISFDLMKETLRLPILAIFRSAMK